MQPSTVTDQGERLIPGTRRPDGTIRKERRIRAGYVPQEEQEVYQSVGVQFRKDIPKCPGMDDDEVEAAKRLAKTKAQKKNEKRKAKRTDEKVGDAASTLLSNTLKGVSLASSNTGPSESEPAADSEQDPKALLEKQIRALNKKLRQCESLAERKQLGQPLTSPEQEKLGKAAAWKDELSGLEAQMQALP